MSTTTQPASMRRVATASLIGTSIEFYDFLIYGTAAALVFGPLFFPPSARPPPRGPQSRPSASPSSSAPSARCSLRPLR